MFEGLDQAQLSGAIEARLFVTDEPVGVIELADMLEADPKLVEQALVDLREKLERERARHPAARGGRRLAAVHAPGLPRAH